MLNIKLKAVVGLLTVAATAAAIYLAYDAGHDAGRASVIEAQTIAQDENLLRRVAHLQKRLDEATAQRKDAQRRALALAERIEQVQQQEVTTREIERVVEVNNCKHLGDDFVRLFNRIHSTGAERRTDSQ